MKRCDDLWGYNCCWAIPRTTANRHNAIYTRMISPQNTTQSSPGPHVAGENLISSSPETRNIIITCLKQYTAGSFIMHLDTNSSDPSKILERSEKILEIMPPGPGRRKHCCGKRVHQQDFRVAMGLSKQRVCPASISILVNYELDPSTSFVNKGTPKVNRCPIRFPANVPDNTHSCWVIDEAASGQTT